MPRYNIIKDYTTTGIIETSARALVAVWKYAAPVQFDHGAPASVRITAATNKDIISKVSGPFVIANDIATLSVSTNLNNHVPSLSIGLRPGLNYLSSILPGDLVAVWIVQDQSTFDSLLTRLKNANLSPCNDFLDGLKFYGKITNVQKNVNMSADGHKSTTYALSGAAFTELDSGVYYEPALALGGVGDGTEWYRSLGIDLNEILAGNAYPGGIPINKIVPGLLGTFLGTGVPKDLGTINNSSAAAPGLSTSPVTGGDENSYRIPSQIVQLFDLGQSKTGPWKFSDLLEVQHGIQTFDSRQDDTPGMFAPDIGPKQTTNLPRERYTGTRQQGLFVPTLSAMNGLKTIWSLLSQYADQGLNQLFVGLRPDSNGKILPTIVCRQIPLTSGLLSANYIPPQEDVNAALKFQEGELAQAAAARKKTPPSKLPWEFRDAQYKEIKAKVSALKDIQAKGPTSQSLKVTRLSDLPRWTIHPLLIKNLSVGRSDALRHNFIHMQIETADPNSNNPTAQIVLNPPVRDEIDIARHGLRPYIRSIPASPADVTKGSAKGWQAIMADILVGQELTLTGQVELVGIVHPINPGDALELDDTIFHIEAVSHTFSMSTEGLTRFTTTLGLTQGTNGGADSSNPLSLYKAVGDRNDLTTNDPAIEVVSPYKDGE